MSTLLPFDTLFCRHYFGTNVAVTLSVCSSWSVLSFLFRNKPFNSFTVLGEEIVTPLLEDWDSVFFLALHIFLHGHQHVVKSSTLFQFQQIYLWTLPSGKWLQQCSCHFQKEYYYFNCEFFYTSFFFSHIVSTLTCTCKWLKNKSASKVEGEETCHSWEVLSLDSNSPISRQRHMRTQQQLIAWIYYEFDCK